MYEVYKATYKDVVVYVGFGVRERHHHCTSGASQVVELNQITLNPLYERDLIVDVIETFNDKKEALQFEKIQIKQLQPLFNKMHNNELIHYDILEKFQKVYQNNTFMLEKINVLNYIFEKSIDNQVMHDMVVCSKYQTHLLYKYHQQNQFNIK